jgi:hypothetical protein
MDGGGAVPVSALHPAARSVEVGVRDPTLGWIEVRAEGAAGQVNATLHGASVEAQAALRAELPGMAQYLAEHRAGVSSLAMAGGNGERGPHSGGDAGATHAGLSSGTGAESGNQRRGEDNGAGRNGPHTAVARPPARAGFAGNGSAVSGSMDHILDHSPDRQRGDPPSAAHRISIRV